jgi:hypothetical protein
VSWYRHVALQRLIMTASCLPKLFPGDFGRAYIIRIDYPWTGMTNDWDMLLIMPTTAGTTWEVCEVR